MTSIHHGPSGPYLRDGNPSIISFSVSVCVQHTMLLYHLLY